MIVVIAQGKLFDVKLDRKSCRPLFQGYHSKSTYLKRDSVWYIANYAK